LWHDDAVRACAIVVVVLFQGFVLPARAVEGGAPEACHAGITRTTTEKLFTTVNRPLPAGTRCKLEAVRTARTNLEVIWSLDGHNLPPVRVVPLLCGAAPSAAAPAGSRSEDGDFVVSLPDEVTKRCPGVDKLLADFAHVLTQEHPVLEEKPRTIRVTAYVLYGIMLGVAVAFAVRELRRKPAEEPPGEQPPGGSNGAPADSKPEA
jgi:hypothetical protein